MQIIGTVRTWDNEKRYGFIKRDDGEDVFVHLSEVRKSHIQGFDRGMRVCFDIAIANSGRPAACNLRREGDATDGALVLEQVFKR